MAAIVFANKNGTRRISTRSEYLRTNGKTTFIGGSTDYTSFDEQGHMIIGGDTTIWDEVSQPLIGRNVLVSVGRIDYNYDNLSLDFSTTARYPEEPVGVVTQTLHARKAGSDIRPHLHWIQAIDTIPNILIEYRFCNNGGVPTEWVLKPLTSTDNLFPFVAGAQQITEFNLPEGHGTTLGLSGSFECKIYRDSANASGLFTGADAYAGVWEVKYYDIHIEMDSLGSREEFTK